ncbi:hypothetical protein BO82DRAFT_360179 [Aspergillus uvarum CBS 121591]|uniref:Uncharacterized protein n=1 Tax=Aspergillus uvarum CBS 121591 TaxID=1448315 RepID=A0A319CS40_9EURO|nr:hypothetical protein BO82DRAFT_360179 [Aspergillus uvarum CBS 121591]PYH87061.1 hypothetical protein BO82DRAFT_360179 [Aspergillus uvarum CBS 121591]
MRGKREKLFRDFIHWVVNLEDRKILKHWWRHGASFATDKELPHQNISRVMDILQELNAVLEELKILQSVTRDQMLVDRLWRENATVKKNQLITPAEQEASIERMIEDVNTAHSPINGPMEQKQKEATIIDSQATCSQGDSIMVFTTVTIFLPASFLTSFFALNISKFPHEDGNFAYPAR